jgi:hypothetical protein
LGDYAACFHQDDVGRQLQDFLELVAHVHHRDGEPVAQGLEIREDLFASGDVEGGERLVE